MYIATLPCVKNPHRPCTDEEKWQNIGWINLEHNVIGPPIYVSLISQKNLLLLTLYCSDMSFCEFRCAGHERFAVTSQSQQDTYSVRQDRCNRAANLT